MSSVGYVDNGTLPNITGYIAISSLVKKAQSTAVNNINCGGAFQITSGFKSTYGATDAVGQSTWFAEGTADFRASDSSSLYSSNTSSVQPRRLEVFYIIKY